MFVLSKMTDTVKIPPWQFNLVMNDAIVQTLNKKFANKAIHRAVKLLLCELRKLLSTIFVEQVVHNVGLCIALWDVTKIEDSYILPGDGSSHTIVHFRYVVFRPFMDEIVAGKIRSSSKEGVHVSLGLFDDIIIPPDALQHPSRFDEGEQLWVWEYATEDGKHDLYMDLGEEIRFRVVDECFVDTTPIGPDNSSETTELTDGDKKSPYTLTGSISEPGLGLLSWWKNG